MLRIAIVDDDKNAIQECKNTIKEMNLPEIQIDIFDDSTHFQDVFFKNMEHFNILILDIDMPHVNGFDIARKIQEWHLQPFCML